MSVFTSQIRNKPWVTQVTVLATALGMLLALSLKTQDRIRGEGIPNMRPGKLASAYAEMRDTVNEQKKKIADLQTNLTRYQKGAAEESGNAKLLSADLQKANLLAGLVAVTGPGVVVTLKDSKNAPPRPNDMTPDAYVEFVKPYLIHDADLQVVVNELRAAGAEAIAINDQRVVATTAIRCVGPVVLVNNTQTNGSPVKIKAVGDPDTLLSALAISGGVQAQYGLTDPSMFSIDKAKTLTLPAYAGATPVRFAKEASANKAEQAQRQSENTAKDASGVTPDGATTPPGTGGTSGAGTSGGNVAPPAPRQ